MNEENRDSYNKKDIVNWYLNLKQVLAVEEKIFFKYRELIANSDFLDIGIGGGRTTRYLAHQCRNYVGIDYSESAIQAVLPEFSNLSIFVADARNMPVFKDNSFDMVNFSYNGIDYVNLEDRIKVLQEIFRVLKPGGIFFFSTHNMKHSTFRKLPWTINEISLVKRIKTFGRLAPYYFRHLSNRRNEILGNTYSVINDSAHGFSLMTFYTMPSFLLQQLRENGFSDIEWYKKNGEPASEEQLDDWIFVVCRKSAD